MTGQSILSRLAEEPPDDPSQAVLAGAAAQAEGAGVLGTLFQARARVLLGTMTPADVKPFVAGILIGEELDAMGPGTGAIFDGYPRTAAQAESLDALLASRNRTLDRVIELDVNEDALVERICGRFTCANCGKGYHDSFEQPRQPGVCDKCGSTEFKRRPDDNEDTVRTRMAEYRAKTAPILPIYEGRGIVTRVNGMADIDDVTVAIERVVTA